ncbi:MAG: bi-domain-containing oxidoreductase [Desulfobacterales bacterium]|nr:bi-domain-containing oxidoreductase [Desulfobacterales bacterium]
MQQIIQNLRNGETRILAMPMPECGRTMVLIKTHCTLISAGTERMLVEFSKGGLIAKAKAQPEKVKQVLDKIKTDGLMPTLETVFKRLDEPMPLGYCNVGEVIEVGARVSDFKIGDRVASNGPHAEIVCVSKNLCAKVPATVSDEQAAFTVLGSIGLQGVRLAQPALGEKFVVVGAGLVGLVVVQLLRASGCEVLAIDVNEQRLEMAKSYGAKACNSGSGDPVAVAGPWTQGMGVDGVIITASAKTDEIVHQAAEMCRKRGRIILIGVVGLNLRRSDFYEKELTFQVSCSYGPGRYDDAYEQKGQDYPIGFVRWTEQRNFQAVLGAMAGGQLNVSSLITDRFPLVEAAAAYEKISNDPSALGIILEYPESVDKTRTISYVPNKSKPAGKCVAAMIGAGNFAKMTMGPALAKTNTRLKYVSARTNAAGASHLAKKYEFEKATTDLDQIWKDPEVNTVFITTSHNAHAGLVCASLEAGKHTFVEKPLCLTPEELKKIILTYRSLITDNGSQITKKTTPLLMVGFNRRFSPHVRKIKELLSSRGEPLAMHFACNAGIIPPNVWVHDPEVGGGRIVGEACHFIDLLSYIAGSRIVSVSAAQMGKGVAIQEDKMAIVLSFKDGSIGTVNYFGNGSKSYPKETLEVYSEGRILRLDNFRKLEGFGFKGFRKFKTRAMDKGHHAEFQSFVDRVAEGGQPLISMDEMINVTLAGFAAVTSACESRMINLSKEYEGLISAD